jgi:hypothetical protein
VKLVQVIKDAMASHINKTKNNTLLQAEIFMKKDSFFVVMTRFTGILALLRTVKR